MLNKSGKGAHSWKFILILVAAIFIMYGYYGYFYVQSQSTFGGASTMLCPLGRGQDIIGSSGQQFSGFQTGPCSYSIASLLIGIILIAVVVLTTFKK
ncbi:MAG: hypothetical protein ABIG20_00595 [archaeon]